MKPLLLCVLTLCGLPSYLFSQTPKYSIGSGEYQNFILDNSTQTLYGLGTGAPGIGTNTGIQGLPIPCQFPSPNTKIKYVAGGLHTGTCIDVNGNVYFTGPNEDGSEGNGTTSGFPNSFVQITTDSLGNPFTNVTSLRMASSIFTGGAGYGAIVFATKSDGTLWVWGNTQGGYRGDGTYGHVNTRPVQVTTFPAGTFITKVIVQDIVIALDSAGKVWTWGGNGGNNCLLGNTSQPDYTHPHMLALPSRAKDIAGGGLWSYALLTNGSLYGWGLYLGYMGVGSSPGSGYTIQPSPILLDADLNLPKPIAKISSNSSSTYAILTDGTLWAWGGNECGQIGNGQELNYAIYTTNPAPYGGTTPEPYAWNWDLSTAQLQQHKPIQIAPGINNFVSLSEGVTAVFYEFAVDANGQLYSWGRNKYGVLANGVMDANYINGSIGSVYPNSWDVPYITAINPFTANKTILSTSPYCISHPGANACTVYTIPANTPPIANAGSNQTVTTSTAVLDGTASSDNVAIVYYVWSQVSGPNNATISIASGPKANLMGLITGVYKFQLKVIDNGWLSDSTTVTVTVNSSGAQPPVANAGSALSITLPVNTVNLVGSGSEVGGTIASYQWTQLSGPSTATFGTSSAAQTTAGSLVQGVYTFQLKITDALNITATATVQVTVNAAIIVGPPIANAGADQTITLPVNSVTLTGSGSESNGTIASYQWTQLSGPSTATIGTATQAQTTMSALVAGVYSFQLTVKDNSGVTATDVVKVTVNAAIVVGPPIANAGADQTITLPVNSVTLTGSGSESNGTIASYQWTQLSGPSTATIGTATQAQTIMSALVAGVYSFQLTVKDNSGVTASDVVKVTVNAAIVVGPPIANAGADQTITLPVNSVTLTGSGSESNGTIASYQWTQLSGPSTATIGTATQAQTTMSGLVQGVYSFQLTVTDNSNVTAADVVKVTVNPAVVVPGTPVVDAGANQTITLPVNSVSLTATASESGGTIVSYQWTQQSGPSTATIGTATQTQTTMSALVAGVYTFQITVTDNSNVTATDIVKVTVNAAVVPGAPVVDAGANQTITLPVNSASLTATASETNGTIVSYQWTQQSGPSTATIGTANQVQTTVSALVAGVYTFQITVTDNSNVTATDIVKVTVNAAVVPGVPVVDAGSNQTITLPVNSATLAATASETNGTIVSYQWTQQSGPSTATIGTATQVQTTVSALVAGVYTFQITVTDNSNVTATDIVKVTVNPAVVTPPPANQPPVANAGPDQNITLPATVTLDGSASYDPDGTIVQYSWIQISGAGGVTIVNASSSMASVYGLTPGVYVFQLTVTDNQGATASSQVTITVSGAASQMPVAIAGSDTTIAYPGSTTFLNGSASYAPGSTITTYSWKEIAGPSSATLATPASATTVAGQLVIGQYTFQLTVWNGNGDSSTSTVNVTVADNLRLSSNIMGVSPNPFPTNTFTINAVNSSAGNVKVTLCDIRGQLVAQYVFDKQSPQFQQTIQVPNVSVGVYILSIQFEGDQKPYIQKLVKQ